MFLLAHHFNPAILNKHTVKLNFSQPHPIVYLQTMCHIIRFKVQGSGFSFQGSKSHSSNAVLIKRSAHQGPQDRSLKPQSSALSPQS
jgi:hypothetical protein